VKTHCSKGHELNAANMHVLETGQVRCRICQAAYFRAWYAKNRERRVEWQRKNRALHAAKDSGL
jgi:hypothetical protein